MLLANFAILNGPYVIKNLKSMFFPLEHEKMWHKYQSHLKSVTAADLSYAQKTSS